MHLIENLKGSLKRMEASGSFDLTSELLTECGDSLSNSR
jgi:hypothetical protein